MADESRKPIPTEKKSAQIILNEFLKDNNILIGTAPPEISQTDKGQILIGAPRIVAIHANEAKPANAEVN